MDTNDITHHVLCTKYSSSYTIMTFFVIFFDISMGDVTFCCM